MYNRLKYDEIPDQNIRPFNFLCGFLAFSCRQSDDSSKAFAPADTAEIKTYKSIGVIKSIDADAGKITVDHEEIPGYMAAMEMTEAVSDAKMLEAVKAGDKIEFEMQRTNANLLITKLTKIGETEVVNGGEIYKMHCAECHGDNGEGALQGISFLKGHALKHPEKDFIKRVTDGKDKKCRPSKKNYRPSKSRRSSNLSARICKRNLRKHLNSSNNRL